MLYLRHAILYTKAKCTVGEVPTPYPYRTFHPPDEERIGKVDDGGVCISWGSAATCGLGEIFGTTYRIHERITSQIYPNLLLSWPCFFLEA